MSATATAELLAALVVIITLARVFGALARRCGQPAVVGIFSAFLEEQRLTIAASASQFEASIRDLIEAGPTR